MNTLIILLLILGLIAVVIWFRSSDSSEAGKREKGRGGSDTNHPPKHPEQK